MPCSPGKPARSASAGSPSNWPTRQTPARAFVELEPRLRLLASPPRHGAETKPEHLRALLREARAAHGLVIVDCGTDWAATGAVLNEASHIVWALPASRTALARAQALLDSDILPRPGGWRELLAATALDHRSTASVRALRHLASSAATGSSSSPTPRRSHAATSPTAASSSTAH